MKKIISLVTLVIATTSCGLFKSVTSNKIIKPNDSFVLGNNVHGNFSVKLKNVSKKDLVVYCAPIAGGTHSYITVKPRNTVNFYVEANTALVIENKTADTATVDLVINGDTGLSMGYKN